MKEDKIVFKGSHIDSLHRVPNSAIGDDRMARVIRVMRWPAALVAVCVALAVFVYFLMPENLNRSLIGSNGTYWETASLAHGAGGKAQTPKPPMKEAGKLEVLLPRNLGTTKTSEIDFYDADNEKIDFTSITDPSKPLDTDKLPAQPVFPEHVDLEVQYGNEKADADTLRTGKVLGQTNTVPRDSTLKPHITQKPEKPLEVHIRDGNEEASTAEYSRADNINEYKNYGDKQPTRKNIKNYGIYNDANLKVKPVKPYLLESVNNREIIYSRPVKVNFTSGHSNLFGISIEDAEKMRSTTQNSLYNTRVSPTLPTWRDRDDTTTKKYPLNANIDVSQCRSTRLPICRGVLPYDLAGPTAVMKGQVEITRYLPQIEYLISTNCSDRIKQFFCSMLEPECSPPPYPTKLPCDDFCKAIMDSCENYMPQELLAFMQCNKFAKTGSCIQPRAPCYSRELTCGDQTCVPRDWVCDGHRDCPGGEDELPCLQCEKSEFRCSTGICIHKRWVCDGYNDCPGGDDEEGCVRQPDDHETPGEEPAGSAPAPAIRRPSKASNLARAIQKSGDTDSSKELLITSDSSNVLRRNFTRRPSPSRLTPYSRTSVSQTVTQKKTFTPEKQRKSDPKPSDTIQTNQKPEHNDSAEDVNIGDLGFLEDSKKESIIKSEEVKPAEKPRMRHFSTTTPAPTRLDKSLSKMERVLDGAALMKAAEEESYSPETNSTNFEDEQPIVSQSENRPPNMKTYSAHSSPCPSGELRCVDGRCITLSQLCDGTIDCTDHADEDNCFT